jgi:hypothetical protein
MNMSARLAPAPRRLPLSLAVLNVFGGAVQIGWFVFGFGMIFFRIFAGHADVSFLTFRGELARTAGKVMSVEATSASINDQTVMANHYEYSVAGRLLSGTSYTTGTSATAGDDVTIEYKPGNPLRSRIEGMRTGMFGSFILFVTIFPLVGAVIIWFGTKGGFRRARLLRSGVLTTGTLTHKEPTNTTINDARVYELTFAFTSRDGRRCEVVARSHQTERLEDERDEPLLYDPNEPSRAYLLDELPGRPEIDGGGELVGRPLALLSLILPALVIGAHVWYLTK